jgi:hypothetical protein
MISQNPLFSIAPKELLPKRRDCSLGQENNSVFSGIISTAIWARREGRFVLEFINSKKNAQLVLCFMDYKF